jgi:glyoxylase-like metal-dependent hydrolase (beta-lactamase superfamily II)
VEALLVGGEDSARGETGVLKARVGSIDIVALVDTVSGYPAATVYPQAGEAMSAYANYLDADGNVVLNFGCYLLRDGLTTVLVDAGWGPEEGGRLPDELAAAGVAAAEVDFVLFTHLHGDHTGWNIDRATGKPLFANARYLLPGGDWSYYSKLEPQPASFARDVVPLLAAGVMELIDGEHSITPGITAVPTPGHTPGHTSAAVVSGGSRGYILGDVVISEVDLAEPGWPNAFDWDNDIARATRHRVLEQLTETTLVGASHIRSPGLGYFVIEDGRRSWQGYAPGSQG